jgi:hypothetical protein
VGRAGIGATGGQPETDDIVKAEIGRDFPGWQTWQSSAGRWWAVRRVAAPPPGAPDEWARTVDGDTPEKLRAALTVQERLGENARL